MDNNTELIIEYIDGGIKTYILTKYNDFDTKPEIWRDKNYIEFKYVAMGKIRTKIIPYSAIRNAELYDE